MRSAINVVSEPGKFGAKTVTNPLNFKCGSGLLTCVKKKETKEIMES
jgi:hypothetical protein